MALGAITRARGLPLRLVPVGLNYFSGHRFRSRVFLDIGEPFSVPDELARLYARGGESKHEATARLMALVESALASVTISATDYETLEFFWTLRRLTVNDDHRGRGGPMSLERQVAFVREFGRGYESLAADGTPFKESARVQHIRQLCSAYNEQLKAMGLRDYQVAHVLHELSQACMHTHTPCARARARAPTHERVRTRAHARARAHPRTHARCLRARAAWAAPGARACAPRLAHAAPPRLRRVPRAGGALPAAARVHAHDRGAQGGAGGAQLVGQAQGARRRLDVEDHGLDGRVPHPLPRVHRPRLLARARVPAAAVEPRGGAALLLPLPLRELRRHQGRRERRARLALARAPLHGRPPPRIRPHAGRAARGAPGAHARPGGRAGVGHARRDAAPRAGGSRARGERAPAQRELARAPDAREDARRGGGGGEESVAEDLPEDPVGPGGAPQSAGDPREDLAQGQLHHEHPRRDARRGRARACLIVRTRGPVGLAWPARLVGRTEQL
mmetsp:Transcript_17378/g.51286  ORF Transcript_17378/g.51286 Transcript_17378/m.51286 type:complete len:506 (-) Transcript_17378:130-1647(-)